MSRGAWGDEGNVATRWEDTAMRDEFDTARNRFNKWIMDYKSEAGSPELEALIEAAETALDSLALFMEGEL